MKLEVIKHRDILFRDLLRAIAMKSVGWPHCSAKPGMGVNAYA